MIDELRKRFMMRFIDVAKERLLRIQREAESARNLPGVLLELHALAGEASALDFGELADLTRQLETLTRAWRESQSVDAPSRWSDEVTQIRLAIETLAARGS